MKLPWYLWLRERPLLGSALTVFMLLMASAATYLSGGSVTSAPHLFYISILLAAFLYGHWGGLVVGVVAGILCGPLMPVNAELGIAQSVDNWVLRLVFFALIGCLTGTLAHSLVSYLHALRTLNSETVLAFVRAVDAKDPYTADHSIRVSHYATAIAETMGLPPADIDRIRWAALLHDVGKLAVPRDILQKQGNLTPDEWDVIKKHPIKSAEIIRGIASFREYIPGVRQHHERVDGTGYPDGVSGGKLCLDARIIAVADAFEAMTSKRPYRDAMPPHVALQRIRGSIGTQFDPEVVRALERALAKAPELLSPRYNGLLPWP